MNTEEDEINNNEEYTEPPVADYVPTHTYVSPEGNAEVWEVKPEGYYTLEEWEELHPPEPIVETLPTPAEQRYSAYMREADELAKQAHYYQDEAEGFRLLDDLVQAAIAEEKAREFFKEYVMKKTEIRLRIPDVIEGANVQQ